jgi:hypothetical protein
LDDGKEFRIVFCDVSKAFDKVWHRGLWHKLKKYGFGENIIWLEHYLQPFYYTLSKSTTSDSVILILFNTYSDSDKIFGRSTFASSNSVCATTEKLHDDSTSTKDWWKIAKQIYNFKNKKKR